MKLRQPRTPSKEPYWSEAAKLTHPWMASTVLLILSVGHFLSPYPLDLERYGLGLLGVLLALLGVYRINEIMDFKRGSIPRGHHMAIGMTLLAIGISIGVYLSWRYAWWVLVLLIVGALGMVLYNVLRSPIIHNRVFYGFIWGGFPFCASYCLQTLSPIPPLHVIAWGAFFSILAVEVLWSWGPVGCRHQKVCKRARPGKVCHSPNMTCADRENIPKPIRVHARTMISIKVAMMAVLTISVYLTRGI
jgi:4-hydroxybenzoate polyprenyltransferase